MPVVAVRLSGGRLILRLFLYDLTVARLAWHSFTRDQ